MQANEFFASQTFFVWQNQSSSETVRVLSGVNAIMLSFGDFSSSPEDILKSYAFGIFTALVGVRIVDF
jgi:hypothetical protein